MENDQTHMTKRTRSTIIYKCFHKVLKIGDIITKWI